MYLPVSIIIPTLNEEKSLPRLLTSIARQTFLPKEVIIADANSKDGTREIAKFYGCTIVEGGLPAKGRNEGAKKASQELLLFLDADVVLPTTFLEKTTQEFFNRKLDIATCFLKPLSKQKRVILGGQFVNSYHFMMKDIFPRMMGICVFAKKKIHNKIHGFDETILIQEDADYAQRAIKAGAKFDFLLSHKIPVSIRRFSEEGKLKTAFKYFIIELYTMFIGKVRKPVFNYQFGHHREM